MTATLSMAVQATNVPPRIALTVTGASAALGTTVTIARRNADGTTYSVRTAAPGALASGTGVFYDYESPFRLGGTYTATTLETHSAGDVAVSLSVDVPALAQFGIDTPWLLHPGIPDLSTQVEVVRLGDRSRPVNQAAHVILGRERPLVVTDVVRGSEQYDLVLRTRWDDNLPDGALQAEDRLGRILADQSPLLFQYGYPGSRRWRWDYLSIGVVSLSDIVPVLDTDRIEWTLPCTVVDAPAGSLQAQWTYSQLAARYATYADVASAYSTYANLAIDRVA